MAAPDDDKYSVEVDIYLFPSTIKQSENSRSHFDSHLFNSLVASPQFMDSIAKEISGRNKYEIFLLSIF